MRIPKRSMGDRRQGTESGLRHLTPNERAALDDFVRRLREKFGDQVFMVRLFGSKARGDFDEESDIDVLVIVRGSNRWLYWRDIVDLSADMLLQYGANISPLILDEGNFARMSRVRAPILESSRTEGHDVWTSPLWQPFAAA